MTHLATNHQINTNHLSTSWNLGMLKRWDPNQPIGKLNQLLSQVELLPVAWCFQVIKVGDVYPSTTKLYVPACTVLHQCGEDTGCCGGATQRCGPKNTQRVELYFHVSNHFTLTNVFYIFRRHHATKYLRTLFQKPVWWKLVYNFWFVYYFQRHEIFQDYFPKTSMIEIGL